MNPKTLELRATFEKLLTEIKADEDKEYIYRALSYVHDRISNMENECYEWQYGHMKGHLPVLNAVALEKLLKTAGMEDHYKVVPPVIFATKGSVEITYSKPAKSV